MAKIVQGNKFLINNIIINIFLMLSFFWQTVRNFYVWRTFFFSSLDFSLLFSCYIFNLSCNPYLFSFWNYFHFYHFRHQNWEH